MGVSPLTHLSQVHCLTCFCFHQSDVTANSYAPSSVTASRLVYLDNPKPAYCPLEDNKENQQTIPTSIQAPPTSIQAPPTSPQAPPCSQQEQGSRYEAPFT